jgi:hypothetical protein
MLKINKSSVQRDLTTLPNTLDPYQLWDEEKRARKGYLRCTYSSVPHTGSEIHNNRGAASSVFNIKTFVKNALVSLELIKEHVEDYFVWTDNGDNEKLFIKLGLHNNDVEEEMEPLWMSFHFAGYGDREYMGSHVRASMRFYRMLEVDSDYCMYPASGPHYRHDSICWGDLTRASQVAFRNGNLFTWLSLVKTAISTYNEQSVFQKLYENGYAYIQKYSISDTHEYYLHECIRKHFNISHLLVPNLYNNYADQYYNNPSKISELSEFKGHYKSHQHLADVFKNRNILDIEVRTDIVGEWNCYKMLVDGYKGQIFRNPFGYYQRGQYAFEQFLSKKITMLPRPTQLKDEQHDGKELWKLVFLKVMSGATYIDSRIRRLKQRIHLTVNEIKEEGHYYAPNTVRRYEDEAQLLLEQISIIRVEWPRMVRVGRRNGWLTKQDSVEILSSFKSWNRSIYGMGARVAGFAHWVENESQGQNVQGITFKSTDSDWKHTFA